MCGIAGVYGRDSAADTATVSRMIAVLAHRGPDDTAVYSDGPVTFGHQRLSIIDLSSGGAQPMLDASGEWLLTYNGEI